jgi:hypothetical protein
MSEPSQARSAGDDGRGRLGPMLDHPAPPAGLYRRTLDALVQRNLLHPPPPPSRRPRLGLLALLTGAACFIVGFGLGARRALPNRVAAPAEHEYALLLYDTADSVAGVDPVEAHRQWAAELARQGHRVSGEELGPTAQVLEGSRDTLAGPATAELALKGFFVVSARTEAEALEIAKTLPHYRHGGRVVVRPIVPT